MVTQEQGKPPTVSVVIPTYNGQRFLGVVLAALAQQALAADRYEVVVIDNNSTLDLFAAPGTQDALAALRAKGVAFRCVPEPRQGLTFARIRGARAARADLLCFLDDDNESSPGYLASGLAALADPRVGLLVSRVFPVYEEPPSPAARRRENLLALNYRLGDASIRWPAGALCPSLGAGMWVRKGALEAIFAGPRGLALQDRTGGELSSGGDIEIGIGVGDLGFDRLYVPDLTIRHHIPAARLQPAYFRRLISGIVRSEATLHARYFRQRDRKVVRLIELLGCAGVGWAVALCRGDAVREYQFMLTAAYSRFVGPFAAP
jgi:glycosyltransferase involved in cell wall biosynthesis